MIHFGINLRAHRKRNRLSQDELGKKLGVQGTTVSNWELSNSSPNIYMIARLCEILDVDLITLVYGEQK